LSYKAYPYRKGRPLKRLANRSSIAGGPVDNRLLPIDLYEAALRFAPLKLMAQQQKNAHSKVICDADPGSNRGRQSGGRA
jgi:hypothetical protein